MKVQPNNLVLIMLFVIFALMTACKNQPESTQSGEGDSFDRNHPMQSEGTNEPVTDTTAPVPTDTDPTAN